MTVVLDVRVQRRGVADPGFPRRFKPIVRDSLKFGGKRWHQDLLGQHFKAGARFAYNYASRGPEYNKAKRRLAMADPLPLIWTGETQRMAQFTAPRITGTSRKATVRVQVPTHFKLGSRNPKTPNLADELTRLNPRDRRKLSRFIDSDIQASLRVRDR